MRNGPTVLVVEDEPILLMLIKDAFTERGYYVVGAINSDSAMRALNDKTQIDCLVTDIRLPADVSGWDIAAAARQKLPQLPVVYMTGDSMDLHKTRGMSGSKLFGKPADISEIVEAASQLMGS